MLYFFLALSLAAFQGGDLCVALPLSQQSAVDELFADARSPVRPYSRGTTSKRRDLRIGEAELESSRALNGQPLWLVDEDECRLPGDDEDSCIPAESESDEIPHCSGDSRSLLKPGEILNFSHSLRLASIINSEHGFRITVVTAPARESRPLSHAPVWFGRNPTRNSHVGLSIGHRTSAQFLEVRAGDGSNLETHTFSHARAALNVNTMRQVDVVCMSSHTEDRVTSQDSQATPPLRSQSKKLCPGGRMIIAYINGSTVGSKAFAKVKGELYHAPGPAALADSPHTGNPIQVVPTSRPGSAENSLIGGRFGDVWDWKFEGRVFSLKIENLTKIEAAKVLESSANLRDGDNQPLRSSTVREPIVAPAKKQHNSSAPKRRRAQPFFFEGNDGRVITWQNDVLPTRPRDSLRIHLCGLQRTGTNLLSHLLNDRELLRRGLWYQPRTSGVNLRGTPPWKHFHLFEETWHVSEKEPSRALPQIWTADDFDKVLQIDSFDPDSLLYVVAVKDPLAWFVSVCEFWSPGNAIRPLLTSADGSMACAGYLRSKKRRERRPAAHILRQTLGSKRKADTAVDEISGNPHNPFIEEYLGLYNSYYLRWIALQTASPHRVELVKYEDVLEDCPRVLRKIRVAANISEDVIRASYCDTRQASPGYGNGGRLLHVSGSRGGASKLWETKKQFYQERLFLQRLHDEDVAAIVKLVHPDILNKFQYVVKSPSIE